MLLFNSALILALVSSVFGGWITFSNENKVKEGLPCVGRLFGNDNYLVSEFDCGATDFNSTFCGIHCFPFSPTTCIGKNPKQDSRNDTANGVWYAPHSVQDSCVFLGAVRVAGNFTKGAPANTTSCGYIDWPRDRNWGPVKAGKVGKTRIEGCWKTDKEPEKKYKPHKGHYYDGARPMDKTFCKGGFAESCGPDEDKRCKYAPETDTRIKCKKSHMPDTSKAD